MTQIGDISSYERATKEMKTQIKRALVFTKKTFTLVTKGRALLQIETRGSQEPV